MSTPPLPAGYALDQSAPPLPAGYSLDQASTDQAPTDQPPAKNKFSQFLDVTNPFALTGAIHGEIADWAAKRVEQNRQENLVAASKGDKAPHSEAVNTFLGSLADFAKMGKESSKPENVALAGGVALANTNPVTAVPVDAALLAHGGYTAGTNAPEALKGNPDAIQASLMGLSEATGGVAGLRAAIPEVPAALKTLQQKAGMIVRDPATGKIHSPYEIAVNKLIPDPNAPQATPAKMISKGTNYGQFLADQKVTAKAEAAQAKEQGNTPSITKVPIANTPAYKLTPESVPGPDTAGKGNLLTPLAKAGDPRAAMELARRGRPVLFVGDENASTPKSTTSFDLHGNPISGTEASPSGIKIENAMGVRWAVSPDGKYRVSVPNSIPDNLVESYATPRLAMQAQQHASLLRQ